MWLLSLGNTTLVEQLVEGRCRVFFVAFYSSFISLLFVASPGNTKNIFDNNPPKFSHGTLDLCLKPTRAATTNCSSSIVPPDCNFAANLFTHYMNYLLKEVVK
jgi:hypothetical protein